MEQMNFEFNVTQPAATDVVEIKVGINPDTILSGYAEMFVSEIQKQNPLMFEKNPITVSEFKSYCNYLLSERINSVHGDCPNWRKNKVLYIPILVQYVMSQIGKYFNTDFGLSFIPVLESKNKVITYETAVKLSDKLALYQEDAKLLKDAFPRSDQGDEDVMSCALIDNEVRATKKLTHPEASYIAAFAGLMLRKETALSVLYRVHYDDVDYIYHDLISNRKVVVG